MRRLAGLPASVLSGVAFLFVLLLSASAAAASLDLSTSYPSVLVSAGDRASFSLRVANGLSSGQTVNLEVIEAPEGWEAEFRGGGRVIRAVHVNGNDATNVDLQVGIPADAQPGTYRVRVRGTSEQASDTLTLSLIVSESATGAAELRAQYPVLEGPSGTEFEFRITLENNSGEELLFALAADAPPGWEVSFQPAFDEKQISSIPVDADGSENIDVRVRTPKDLKAGEYPIRVTASAPGANVDTELKVVITGSYDLQLQPADERFNFDATAGRETKVRLLVVNQGTAPLTGVTLRASTPAEWEVTFDPEEISSIAPGESQEVTMAVKPRDRAIAGDYIVEINANADQASDSAEFRVTVKTPTLWGWVGLFLVAAAVAGTFTVFRVYGRR